MLPQKGLLKNNLAYNLKDNLNLTKIDNDEIFLVHRLMFAIISVDNLIELLEARTPFQGNVRVKELIASLNITSCINLKPVML